ncbi:DUF7522 family protein [Halarchaeum nitratireducens]|uniref:Uncharacterized protein n=1 Tax=Halarchaeum nitratireducens TaxID=489913 RepID=A0A830GA01_9EURY|nr:MULTISPECIES: hypothetical protein [Halarchaeum]MBP2250121.1 hypothetical protein [Halarchaeum solikamskense]GGN11298.1 hypothetical protein GCM10009021_09050 [Halarchaeum nitratireducens]
MANEDAELEHDLLSEEARERLRIIARTALGDSLRSVTYFTHTDYEQVYLRSDLERDADLSAFIGAEWQSFQLTQDAYAGSELGEYDYTIRAFSNGYLLRVTTDREGVFLTTDGLTMTDVESCAAALEETLDHWREGNLGEDADDAE